MVYETIQLEMRGAVCLLTLNRPDRLNALTVEVARDFQAAVQEALEKGSSACSYSLGRGAHFVRVVICVRCRTLQRVKDELEAFFDEPLRILNERDTVDSANARAFYCRGKWRCFGWWL